MKRAITDSQGVRFTHHKKVAERIEAQRFVGARHHTSVYNNWSKYAFCTSIKFFHILAQRQIFFQRNSSTVWIQTFWTCATLIRQRAPNPSPVLPAVFPIPRTTRLNLKLQTLLDVQTWNTLPAPAHRHRLPDSS